MTEDPGIGSRPGTLKPRHRDRERIAISVSSDRGRVGEYLRGNDDRSYGRLASEKVPATVRRFVENHFDTVTAVEVLLFLRRESPRALSSRAVAGQLRIDPAQSEGILTCLDQSGLVRRNGPGFEYDPRTEEAAGAVDTLADVYPRYRHRIIGIIFQGG